MSEEKKIVEENWAKKIPMTHLSTILTFLTILLVATSARPVAAQTVTQFQANAIVWSLGSGFPFPQNFVADSAIAIYDTNGNGFIDTYTIGDRNTVLPFIHTGVNTYIGSHIGSPFVIDVQNPVLGASQPFCGDFLVYAEQFDQATQTTFFVWFAFPDPARVNVRTRLCGNWAIDFGAGSYTGSRDVRNATNIHHASYVGGQLTSNGVTPGVTYRDFRFSWIPPGTIANPGYVVSRHPNDDFAAMPYPLAGFRAGEPGGTPFDNHFIDLTNVVIDVPLIREEAWDGQFLLPKTTIARRIQALGSGGQSFGAAASSSATLWTPDFSDNAGPLSRDEYLSIKLADVNGDGRDDLCARDGGGIACATSTGSSFNTLSRWTGEFGAFWSGDEAYWGTIQYPDVNGDGKADVCGRGYGGIICGLSNGTSFSTPTVWSAAFSDINGWASHPSYWKTIQFPDLNNDGMADVCGRGIGGIYCALSNGTTSFGTVMLWSSAFSDANGWKLDPSYWSTIQFADVDGDTYSDVCGRGYAGVWCALNGLEYARTSVEIFANPVLWTRQYSDAFRWNTDSSYWSTIQLADINGDGKADICGRGINGLYCGQSTGRSFDTPSLGVPEFSDANGWRAEQFYKSIRLVDVNGDGRADACGRGIEGIYCAKASLFSSTISFEPIELRVTNFGDVDGWGTSESYWGTVQPGNVARTAGARWCGRGSDGIYCSN